MRPRIFPIASVLSLLLCLALVVMWVRSFRVADGWTFAPRSVPLRPTDLVAASTPVRAWRIERLAVLFQGRVQLYERQLPQLPGAQPGHVGYRNGGTINVPTSATPSATQAG